MAIAAKKKKDLLSSGPIWPEVDDQIIDTLVSIANGAPAGFTAPQLEEQARALGPELRAVLQRIIEDPAEAWEREYHARMAVLTQGGVTVSLGSAIDGKRPRPAYFRSFRDLPAMLSQGVLLLLDSKRPYAKALRRCQNCSQFYLARRNPKGGPANVLYCSPRCRARAHDSSEARAKRRARVARKRK